MSKFFKFVIFGLVIYNYCRRHNPIFKHKRPSTFLTDVTDFPVLIDNLLTGILCGWCIGGGSSGIRRRYSS